MATSCATQAAYPSQTPVIYSLTPDAVSQGEYTSVRVLGANFVYGAGATTAYITSVTTGVRVKVPCAFYSTLNCAFVMPVALAAGQYTVEIAVKCRIYGSNVVSPAISNAVIIEVV